MVRTRQPPSCFPPSEVCLPESAREQLFRTEVTSQMLVLFTDEKWEIRQNAVQIIGAMMPFSAWNSSDLNSAI